MNIYQLIHVAHIKNQVNLRRRRFYHLANPFPAYKWADGFSQYTLDQWQKTKEYASYQKGYEEAKIEMKAMTPIMREVCKELNAKFQWDDSGRIWAIRHEGIVYNFKNFHNIANEYLAERILLGG